MNRNSINMLEYAKMILKKVAFNRYLFLKEYKKFIRMLPDEQSKKLIKWRHSSFKDTNLSTKKTIDVHIPRVKLGSL